MVGEYLFLTIGYLVVWMFTSMIGDLGMGLTPPEFAAFGLFWPITLPITMAYTVALGTYRLVIRAFK